MMELKELEFDPFIVCGFTQIIEAVKLINNGDEVFCCAPYVVHLEHELKASGISFKKEDAGLFIVFKKVL